MTRQGRRCAAALALVLAMCLCWTALAESGGLGTIGRIGHGDSANGAQAASPVKWITGADQDSGSGTPETKEWTFLVYLCGSDLGMSARADMEEMAASGFDEDRMNVVVYTGGARFWGGADIPTDMLAMQEIHNGVVKQVDAFPLADMSASETLCQFLTVASGRYPARKYALILWDHGGGPNGGLFMDMLFNEDPMSLAELKSALGDSPFGSGKLEFIGFDACLMGGVEVAKAVAPYAGYMLASEESEPGLGWNYAFLGELGSDSSMEDIAQSIIDRYFESIQEKSPGQVGKNTLSCVDLSKMDEVEASCEAFFKDTDALLTGDTYVKFAKARDKALYFGDNRHDLVDIGCFVKNLDIGAPQSQEKVLDALAEAVICNRSDSGKAFGLSIYHPYFMGNNYFLYMEKYSSLAPCPEYAKYIDRFTEYLTGKAQADWSALSTLGQIRPANEIQRDMNTNFTLKLTAEQIDFMAEAQLQVFESPDGGASCALVSFVPEVSVGEDNTVSASYVHRGLFITDGDGGAISPALPYDVVEDGLYTVEATLVGKDAEGGALRQPVRLLYALDEAEAYDGALALRQVEVLDERDGTYTTRHNIDLADFDSLQIVRELRSPTTLDGTTLNGYDQWETVDSQVCEMPLDGSQSLRMLHDALERKDLYVAFAIRDYQNRRYTSSLIALEGTQSNVVKLTYDNDYLDAYMPFPTLETAGTNPGMGLSLRVANHSGVADALFRVTDLRLNGQPTDLTLEIYGNGPNEGLLIDEEEAAPLRVPATLLQGLGTVETLDFDIHILDASNGDSEVYTVPVHGELNIDVGAFN